MKRNKYGQRRNEEFIKKKSRTFDVTKKDKKDDEVVIDKIK